MARISHTTKAKAVFPWQQVGFQHFLICSTHSSPTSSLWGFGVDREAENVSKWRWCQHRLFWVYFAMKQSRELYVSMSVVPRHTAITGSPIWVLLGPVDRRQQANLWLNYKTIINTFTKVFFFNSTLNMENVMERISQRSSWSHKCDRRRWPVHTENIWRQDENINLISQLKWAQ